MPSHPPPVIEPDSDSREFWAAVKNGFLEIQRCLDCGTTRGYPQTHCPACLSSRREVLRCSGEGTVFTFTTVHRAPSPEFTEQVPYSLALVDLAEGARFLVRVAAGDRPLAVGASVRARFVGDGDRLEFPVFEVVG